MSKSNINIFACGGVGMKAIGRLMTDKNIPLDHYNRIFCDTSLSDVEQAGINTNKEIVYIPPGIDKESGSGSLRSTHAKAIKDSIPDLMNKHWSENQHDLNIVVSSTAGGTGNIFAHHIVRYLLEKKMQVIYIFITSDVSGQAIDNTLNVISGIESLPAATSMPLTIYPIGYTRQKEPNSGLTTFEAVENEANTAISRLIFLYGTTIAKFDYSDKLSWLCFNRMNTSVQPRLNRLYIQIKSKDIEMRDIKNVMSVASVYPRGAEPDLDSVMCNYVVDGFSDSIDKDTSVHYILAEDGISSIGARLKDINKKIHGALDSRSKIESFGFSTRPVDDDGLVM